MINDRMQTVVIPQAASKLSHTSALLKPEKLLYIIRLSNKHHGMSLCMRRIPKLGNRLCLEVYLRVFAIMFLLTIFQDKKNYKKWFGRIMLKIWVYKYCISNVWCLQDYWISSFESSKNLLSYMDTFISTDKSLEVEMKKIEKFLF